MKHAFLIKNRCKDYAVPTRALNSLNCVFRETDLKLGDFVTCCVTHKIKSQGELSCITPCTWTFRHVYIDTRDRFRRTADLVILNRREDAFMGIASITMGLSTFYFSSQFRQCFLPAAGQSKAVRFWHEAQFFGTGRKIKKKFCSYQDYVVQFIVINSNSGSVTSSSHSCSGNSTHRNFRHYLKLQHKSVNNWNI